MEGTLGHHDLSAEYTASDGSAVSAKRAKEAAATRIFLEFMTAEYIPIAPGRTLSLVLQATRT
jgi:hypothetical protein